MAKYVDNERLSRELKEYYDARMAADAAGEEVPVIPRYIGECVLKMAKRYSTHSKFMRVPFRDRDDLISEGIHTALHAIRNTYDPARAASGFSFLTATIKWGFLGVITAQHKYLNSKNSYMEAFASGQVHVDEVTSRDLVYHSHALDPIREKVDEFRRGEEERAAYIKARNEKRALDNPVEEVLVEAGPPPTLTTLDLL